MKSYNLFITVFLILICSNLFATSPKVEAFTIRNYSSKNVVVNVEFWESTGGKPEFNYIWEQSIFGIPLAISDELAIIGTNILRPNRVVSIIQYFPLGFDAQPNEKYDKMFELPFMGKIRAIIKKLEIICNDGKTIITLENLGEKIIKRNETVGGVFYTLEIFDYDLLGKPASEW